MQTAKLFASGRSQAVRLPETFRFEGEGVAIKRLGISVLLLPIESPWEIIQTALDEFEPNFEIKRAPQGDQERADLL